MMRGLLPWLLLTLMIAAGVVIWQKQPAALLDELIEVGEVLTPEPLKGPLHGPGGTLTTAGILAETNRQRATEQLPALAANATLDQAAQKKVADMFARHYFAHEAPDGTGPADLVDSVHYEYIRVGENLALGNFESDAVLVQAWMDSPGHRANIMHEGFSELGLAVGRGDFEGTEVWLAVQTFGAPLSDCPAVDQNLQKQFEALKNKLDGLVTTLQPQQDQLANLQKELDSLAKEIQSLADAGQEKIAAGNAKIQQGNEAYENTGDRDQAQPYWDEGERLQHEGQALLDQAETKQKTYADLAENYEATRTEFNQRAETQRTLSEEIQTVQTKLNQQIRAFNACIK
jgi:hypothetical protein